MGRGGEPPTPRMYPLVATAQEALVDPAEMPEPIRLPSLDTEHKKPFTIDEIVLPEFPLRLLGKNYTMLSTMHLGTADQQRVFAYWGSIQAIEARIRDNPEEADSKDDDEILINYDKLFKLIIPQMPRQVLRRMLPDQRRSLFTHFLDCQVVAYRAMGYETEETTATATAEGEDRSTGDTTSPA